ncbi:hypothetical protein D9M70_480900 [compost metagenome]
MPEFGLPLSAGEIHDLPDPDDGDERRVLQHCDELVAGRRDDDAHRLRHDHQRHRLARAKAECGRAFRLAPRDALDPGPEDLRHIGAIAERQRQDARRHRADDVADLRQAEIDDVDLHQQGQTAEERGVEGRETVDHAVLRQLRNCPDQRDEGGDRDRDHRDIERRDDALGDQVADLLGDEGEGQIERVEEQHQQDEELDPDADHLSATRQLPQSLPVRYRDQRDHQGADQPAERWIGFQPPCRSRQQMPNPGGADAEPVDRQRDERQHEKHAGPSRDIRISQYQTTNHLKISGVQAARSRHQSCACSFQ